MKYAISCSGNAIGKVESLETTLSIMAEAGYSTIDFWLYVYSESEGAPLRQNNWREWCSYARDLMEKHGIVPGQCHCQWQKTHTFAEGTKINPPSEIYHRSIEACHLLGCRKIIFHPPFYIKRVPDEATRMAVLDGQAGWFQALLPTAERFGVELHLENTFDFRHVQQDGDPAYVGIAAWEMLYLAKKLNHPLVKLCLDTGHAHLAHQDVPAMIREMDMTEQCMFSSFNHYTIKLCRSIAPELECGILYGYDNEYDHIKRAIDVGAKYIHPHYKWMTPENVAYAKANNIGINVWTVDGEDDIKKMIAYGVDSIITNKPDLCRAIVDSL